ncbi:sensor histidine kinase [Methylobrevis pamukkalensis]|uniref:histidine kinase n=1 Tax=Methylobrevis pamukkalensis TaxID=1439726 RepID=A0A1E3GYP4_9HYPH|nr:HAMP domain-containing sensor histidine kinase [Methylobrevis pamukkalensis]ODN69173.1 Nitrogen regulation protein NR(II) [Methylobrevis pamukkalensis]
MTEAGPGADTTRAGATRDETLRSGAARPEDARPVPPRSGAARPGTSGADGDAPPVRFGLSARLLVLTILFVMISEVLIYVPSIANYHRTILEARLHNALIASRSLMLVPAEQQLPQDMQSTLLEELGGYAIAVKDSGMKRLLAITPQPPTVDRVLNIDDLDAVASIGAAFDTLVRGGDRTIRLYGPFPGSPDQTVEFVFPEKPLRDRMLTFSANILLLSLVISCLTASLVYLALQRLLIRPMQRIGRAVRRFTEDPENPATLLQPTGRTDEIGAAEHGLASMQLRLQEMLKQQRHLADLGLAVSKINHDLRNMLASAQLVSDRLAMVSDPTVQRVAPKLIAALDRAITYCQSVLAYGRAQEQPPARRLVALRRLCADVGETTGVAGHGAIEWVNAVAEDVEVDCDPDQISRVLVNLVRNAAQALEATTGEALVRRLTLSAERVGSVVRIRVSDTGPGLAEKARESLFKAFQGSVRRGGTGLGLAISAELVRAHGGSITLLDITPGATFEVEIPDRPVQLRDVLRSRAS